MPNEREGPILPLSGTLRTLHHQIPATLISANAWTRLDRLTRRLPAVLTRWLYLECRLDGTSDQVDLIALIEREGRDVLAGLNPAAALAPELAGNGLWARVVALSQAWADPASPLHATLASLWLEFDLPADVLGLPLPGVFIGFTEAAHTQGSNHERFRLAEQALRPLLHRPLAGQSAARLGQCYAALPAGASVPYAGVLLPRGSGTVRLCVTGLTDRQLIEYLAEIAWPGDLHALADELARVAVERRDAAMPEAALLHIDVGRRVSARIGLEYVCARTNQAHGLLRETAFLDALVARSLCTPRHRQALAGIAGVERRVLPHELWPSYLIRRVNHVKLVFGADGAVQAKGYLSVHHKPIEKDARPNDRSASSE